MNDTEYKIQLVIDAQNVASAEITKLQKQISDLQWSVKDTEATASEALSSIKGMLGTLSVAAVVAGIGAIGKASVDAAMQIEPIRNSFQRLSAEAGIAGDQMLSAMRKASLGTVSDFNLMSAANKAYSLGVVSNTEQMTTLLEIARVKGQTMWRTMTEALDDIVTGLGRGSAQILDNLWIVVNQTEAQEQYAASIGKTVDQLSEAEKKQALINKVVSDGKQELEATWQVALTLAERQAQMTTARENMQVMIWEALTPTIGDLFDKANARLQWHTEMIANAVGQIWDFVHMLYDTISGIVSELRSVISENVELGSQLFAEFFSFLGLSSSDTASGIVGDFSDVIYIFQQGLTVISAGVKMLVSSFRAGASAIGNMFVAIVKNVMKLVEDMVNGVIEARNRVAEKFWWDAVGLWDSWVAGYSEARDQAVNNMAETATDASENIKDTWNKMWDDLIKNYEKKIKKVSGETKESLSQISNLLWGWSDLWGAGAGGKTGGKEKNSNLEKLKKEMEDYAKETKKIQQDVYKAVQKEADNWLANQVKNINELDKEFQKSFDKIQDKIDDTTKNIENLTKGITDLRKKLVELQVEQTQSVAKEYVKAKKEMESLEEQYKGLKEVADGVSRADLKGVGGIGKYDVDLIKKYKDYQDEMKSAYSGLSEEERKAMDKQIAYQERYRWLNNVEKIKEDYRIKKEEVQSELDAKISALNTEQETLRSLKKEQQKLQDEWIKRIDEEVQKWKEMSDKKKDFEKEYMEILEINHQKQVDMTNKLVEQWNAVYRAKMRAMSGGGGGSSGSRASGWPVYQGNAYLVGEAWPEMFVPATNGKIVKNSELWAGGGNISVNVNLGEVSIHNWGDETELTQKITDSIIRQLVLYKKWMR